MIKKNRNDIPMLLYFFILMISGIVMGFFLSKYINIDNFESMSSYLSVLIKSVDKNQYLISQFMLGSVTTILIALLGTALCGIPLISFLIYTKGAQIGFSCALFLDCYALKGILGIFLAFIPQMILDIVSFYIICNFSLLLSLNIVKTSISPTTIPYKTRINKLLNVLILCIFLILISSYFKSTLGITLIKFFESI